MSTDVEEISTPEDLNETWKPNGVTLRLSQALRRGAN